MRPSRLILLIIIAAAVGALVALRFAKIQMESMSDDELRAYVDAKLADRLTEEQLAQAQEALVMVAAKMRATENGDSDSSVEESAEAAVEGGAG